MPTPYVKPTQAMLGLPAERLAQLRALADHHGVTAVEIIERTIRRAIEAKEIPDDLPGLCEVATISGQEMIVTVRGQVLPPLDRAQARGLAVMLKAASGREALPDREFRVGSALSLPLGHGYKVYVGRHVRAVLLHLVHGKTGETTLRTATTASLASDFADILRKHADQMAPPAFHVEADGSIVPSDFLMRLVTSESTMPNISTSQENKL